MTAPKVRYCTPSPPQDLNCSLCPRRCRIAPGSFGACRVRQNDGGEARLPYYGCITALAEDPMEKKPLYHFRPGEPVLSLGFAGCNLRCPFCQNWHISQTTEVRGRYSSVEELIAVAKSGGFRQIAYTYSEPLVHAEFLLDCMTAARESGIANVLVSNGCAGPEAAGDILALTDAANIDLKAFSVDTYSQVLGGDLDAVCCFIKAAHEAGILLELTTLIVPGLNDSLEETEACADFIAGLSPEIPWHLSAYHPDYRWKAPPTDPQALLAIARRAERKLRYVYTGNLPSPGLIPGSYADTSCAACGAVLVHRRGYRVSAEGLKREAGSRNYVCAACGKTAPIRA